MHGDVRGDLARIRAESPSALARIAALIRQLQADPRMAEKLLDHGFGAKGGEAISASKWITLWKQGLDIWRLKDWSLEHMGLRYRVIYLYLRSEARFVIMAIVKREEWDYDDEQHPIRQRILASARASYGVA